MFELLLEKNNLIYIIQSFMCGLIYFIKNVKISNANSKTFVCGGLPISAMLLPVHEAALFSSRAARAQPYREKEEEEATFFFLSWSSGSETQK